MKPNAKERNLVSSTMGESGSFGISKEHAAHIMTILRNTMYTDKILAVLREYSANAWDAHRMVGKLDVPIKVTLPSELEPTLCIRDFGPGISPEDIFKVYTQYGASTKRDNDIAVGMLGIGSKSGFAYSDSFTVVSYFGGKKSTYVAVLDKTNVGIMTLLDQQDCGKETGIEIQVPVKPADINAFIDRSKTLFRYFKPPPDINTEIGNEFLIQQEFSRATLLKGYHGGWTAVMGCIPYRINLNQVDSQKVGPKIHEFLDTLTGLMYFNIGEVEIAASREELNYSDETKKVLEARFTEFIDEFVQSALKEVEASGLTHFERRLRLWSFPVLQFSIPESLKPLMIHNVEIKDSKLFSFHSLRSEWSSTYHSSVWKMSEKIEHLTISRDTVLVLKDDSRIFRGFELNSNMVIVESIHKKKTVTELTKELDELLKKLKIDGLPIKKLSEIPWAEPAKANRRTYDVNEKHKVSGFKLSKKWTGYGGGSDVWDISRHTPDEKDVFVILSKFKVESYNFYMEFRHFTQVVKVLKQPIPTIYGYKTTAKKPLDAKDIKGTEFLVWRDRWFEELGTIVEKDTAFAETVRQMGIFECGAKVYGRDYAFNEAGKGRIAELRKSLGDEHPITKHLVAFASTEVRFLGYEDSQAFGEIRRRIPSVGKIAKDSADKFDKEHKRLMKEYPLFAVDGTNLARLFQQKEEKHWIEYIKAVDHLKGTKHVDGKAEIHPDGRVADDRVGGAAQDGSQVPAELRETPAGALDGGLGQHPQVPDGVQGPVGVCAG